MKAGNLPAAKIKRGRQSRDDDGLDKIGHQEHSEFHSGILDVIADDFAFAFRKIKGRSFGFRRGRGQEK